MMAGVMAESAPPPTATGPIISKWTRLSAPGWPPMARWTPIQRPAAPLVAPGERASAH